MNHETTGGPWLQRSKNKYTGSIGQPSRFQPAFHQNSSFQLEAELKMTTLAFREEGGEKGAENGQEVHQKHRTSQWGQCPPSRIGIVAPRPYESSIIKKDDKRANKNTKNVWKGGQP